MQTKLNDPRFYVEQTSLEAANKMIADMRHRLEEADKLLMKPDYGVVEELRKIDFSDGKKAKESVDIIIADIKSRPITEKKTRAKALYILPYHKGKPNYKGKRKLTDDLTKKKQFERYAAMGTDKFTKTVYRTQFPAGLKDKDQNCEWPFKPERLEIVEED